MRYLFTNFVKLDSGPHLKSCWIHIRIEKNSWIRIRKKWMRIHSPGRECTDKILIVQKHLIKWNKSVFFRNPIEMAYSRISKKILPLYCISLQISICKYSNMPTLDLWKLASRTISTFSIIRAGRSSLFPPHRATGARLICKITVHEK